jgi:hypothetical protein
MLKYVIRREHGTSEPDGGEHAKLRYAAKRAEMENFEGESTSESEESDQEPDQSSGKSSSRSGGGAKEPGVTKATFYVTRDNDRWPDVLMGCGVQQDQQRLFLKWLSRWPCARVTRLCEESLIGSHLIPRTPWLSYY